MALTKSKKDEVVSEIAELLKSSKMTVVAQYQGTDVKALQSLRKDAKASGTRVKVAKNRLVIQAIKATKSLKDADTSALTGMLLFAFNNEDEVAPAQSLHNFAKTNPTLEFVGAYSADGKFLTAEEVSALAVLPSKPQLIAQVVATLLSPVHDVTNALSGNLHALLDGIEAKASA
ncbi:MAG: 50S ribosomal protein L10 [Candidatus Saccharimonadales bacterium]